MVKTALCTIIAKNYLPFARVLMESVKTHHPEFHRFVLLIDDAEGYFDPDAEDFTIHSADTIGVPDYPFFCVKYNILEISTAVKPYYLEYLFREYDLDNVLYFDPDIMLFAALVPVMKALETATIVLTPHLTGFLDNDYRPNEWEIMRAGAYNLGFIGLHADEETRRFLTWWQTKLYNDCISAVEENLFVDQRWVDLVPGIFHGVTILHDPGLNVAYWNLPHRTIIRDDARFFVNGQPLRFFHFSGFRAENHETPSRYQDRYTMENVGPAVALFERYREAVFSYGYAACKDWQYTYGSFGDGSAIPDALRRILRDDLALQRDLMERYHLRTFTDVRDFVLDYANQPFDDRQSGSVLITRFAHKLYLSRPDVQRVFPDLDNAHRQLYAEWLVQYARRDYHFGWPVVRAIVESLETHDWSPRNADFNDGNDVAIHSSVPFHASHVELRDLRDELEQTTHQLRQRANAMASWTRALQRRTSVPAASPLPSASLLTNPEGRISSPGAPPS